MIRHYFKQAWQLLKDNKLFSTIYILGTALAITMIMIVSVYLYMKEGNIAPEVHRSRMMYVATVEIRPKDSTQTGMAAASLSYQTVKNVFYPLKSAERVSAELQEYGEEASVSLPGQTENIPTVVKYVDAAYWDIFRFSFVEGHPFSTGEFQSGIRTAVIAESFARQLFGTEPALNKRFLLDSEEFMVGGVVKDVSYILPNTFSLVWLPYTVNPNWEERVFKEGLLGFYKVYILAHSSKDFNRIKKEIESHIGRYEANLTWKMDLMGQPDDTFTHSFRKGNRALDMPQIKAMFALLLIIFLMVPALNLSGLNSSRMEKRTGELGIRKAFGAPRSVLIQQVLTENLLLSFIGGVVGLIVSYALVFAAKEWLASSFLFYTLSNPSALISSSVGITPAMLFNIEVFLWAFIAVLVMNVLSALVPAYRFSRRTIIDSLDEKI